MMDQSDLRSVPARLRPESRRRILGLAASLLLGAVVIPVVMAPDKGLALVALALSALFLVAKPHWGILAIFVLVIFRLNPAEIGPLGTSELIAAPLMLPLALELLRDRGIWVWHVPQVRLLLGIGGVLLAASGWSLLMHPAPPVEAAREPWDALFLFGQQLLFLIYFVYFIKTPRHLVYAVVVLLLMIVATAVDSLDLLEGGPGKERLRGNYGWLANSNRLAFFCVWGTALFWSLRFKGPAGWWRPLTLVPLLGLPITTLMTGSRNGLLQLLLLGGLILLEQRQWSPAQRARAFALMVAAAIVVLVAVPTALLGRASTFEETSVMDRIATHWLGAELLAENPIFGVGPGNFHWRNLERTGHPMSTHNSYLWALTSGGPLLILLYLALFYRTHRMLRAVERWAPGGFVWLATALRFNLIIFLTFSFFADMWLTQPFYLLLGLAIVLFRIARAGVQPTATVSAPVTVATT